MPPEAAVAAQLDRAARADAELRFDEPVLSWTERASGVRVTTTAGTYDAGGIVLAPGRWAPELLPDLPVPLVVQGRVMHWFDPPGGADDFADLPVWIWDRPDGTSAYGAPPVAGPRGGLKAAVHHSASRPAGDWSAAQVAALVAPLLPGLGDRVLRSVACAYTLTPEHDPVVGRHPCSPQAVVACGFSGHGFKLTPVLGEVLAELVLEGATAYDLSLLDPLR